METKTSYITAKDMLLKAQLPQETKTYKPISHAELIDLTLGGIETSGFKLDKETYSSAREGKVANGRFAISNVADTEMQLEIGWQNSYDKSLTLKFAIGARIFICQNGVVHGDMGNFKKKHTGEIQEFTPKAITEYIKQAGEVFSIMQKEREKMKDIQVSKRTAAELIGRMMIEEKFIHSTQVNIIAKELNDPTHDYGCPGSMWELYNFTTFAMKEIHPSLWMKNHTELHSFFVNESGIIVPNMEIDLESSGLEQLALAFPDAVEIE